ncbi:MAG: PH domain-containing protein [Acidobacteriota bacterium]
MVVKHRDADSRKNHLSVLMARSIIARFAGYASLSYSPFSACSYPHGNVWHRVIPLVDRPQRHLGFGRAYDTMTDSASTLPAAPVVFRQTFLFVGLWYAGAVVLTIVLVVLGGIVETIVWTDLAPAIPFLTIGLCLVPFGVVLWKHAHQWTETYTLTPDTIEISTGMFSRTVRNIPLSKVEDVTVEQTLLQRLFGLGQVIVNGAATTGQITLRHIHQPHAVAEQILQRVGAPHP